MERLPIVPPPEQRIKEKTARQIWLQVYLPLGLGVLILGGVGLGVVARAFGTISVWADVALVLLAIPAFLLGLIALVVFSGVTYATFWMWGRLPDFFAGVREVMKRVEAAVRKGADFSVKPVFGMGKVGAAIRSVRRGLRSFFRS